MEVKLKNGMRVNTDGADLRNLYMFANAQRRAKEKRNENRKRTNKRK